MSWNKRLHNKRPANNNEWPTTDNESAFCQEALRVAEGVEGWREKCGVPGSCFWLWWLCLSTRQMNCTPALPKLTSCLVVATCVVTNSKSGNYLHLTVGLEDHAWTRHTAKRPQPYYVFIHFGQVSVENFWTDDSILHLGTPIGLDFTIETRWRRVFIGYQSRGGSTRWRSWLRHCATSRKVAGSIPDGVTGMFHWHNPFGRTMALGSTQPLTEMSTRNISWG
jgi:hypothetical protein